MPAASKDRALPLPSARLLSRPEAAGYIGVSPTMLDRLISEGTMPKPLRLGVRLLWDVRRHDAAIEHLPGSGESTEGDVSACNDWD